MPEKPSVNKMSRRRFLGAAVATAGVAAIGAKSVYEYDVSKNEGEDLLPEVSTESAEIVEIKERLTDSFWFNSLKEEFAPTLARDLEIFNERLAKIEGMENFSVQKIDDEIIREGVEEYIVGIVFAESRGDIEAKNGEAFGPYQLTEGVWKEHAREESDRDSVASQAEVAGKLFEQAYRHITNKCQDALKNITNTCFSGNENDMKKFFLLPALINSNTAGMGYIANIINWFNKEYLADSGMDGLTDKLELKTKEQNIKPSGYDVFYIMTLLAYNVYIERQKQEKKEGDPDGWYDWYGDHSYKYTYRVYAAKELQDGFLDKQRS